MINGRLSSYKSLKLFHLKEKILKLVAVFKHKDFYYEQTARKSIFYVAGESKREYEKQR